MRSNENGSEGVRGRNRSGVHSPTPGRGGEGEGDFPEEARSGEPSTSERRDDVSWIRTCVDPRTIYLA